MAYNEVVVMVMASMPRLHHDLRTKRPLNGLAGIA